MPVPNGDPLSDEKYFTPDNNTTTTNLFFMDIATAKAKATTGT